MDVLSRAGASLVLDGIVHLFEGHPPKECMLPGNVRLRAAPCAPGCDAYVVYTPRAVKGAFSLLSEIGKVTRLNSVCTLFKITAPFKGWVPELKAGCLALNDSPAFIRPYVSTKAWKVCRRAGTLLLRGPQDVDAIWGWWPALGKANEEAAAAGKPPPVAITRSASGRTWFIHSPFRKADAPARGRWTLIPAGHCFGCGRPGHTESNCPVRKAQCALCGSCSHTAEVCNRRECRLSRDTARKHLWQVGAFVREFPAKQELPRELCFHISRACGLVAKFKRNKASRRAVQDAQGGPSNKKKQQQKPRSQQQQQQQQLKAAASVVPQPKGNKAQDVSPGDGKADLPNRHRQADTAEAAPSPATPLKRTDGPQRVPVTPAAAEPPSSPDSPWTGESPLVVRRRRARSHGSCVLDLPPAKFRPLTQPSIAQFSRPVPPPSALHKPSNSQGTTQPGPTTKPSKESCRR